MTLYTSTYNRTHTCTYKQRTAPRTATPSRTHNYNPSFLPTPTRDVGQEGRIK